VADARRQTGTFQYRRRVEFAETDMAGIVHFSMFFRYMEEAEHALWRAAGLSIARPGEKTGWPRLSATFDFRNPLRFEDEFEVAVSIEKVTSRTIEYVFTVRRGDTFIGAGAITTVHIRKSADGSMKAIQIPPAVVARLRAALG
jgi:YbgC/YbaW family acyl-CoA thioester hydrolase